MLNEEQQKAVSIIFGPLQVIAGAGTGKTRVLIERTCHLIENGILPSGILLLTFTNKAANEIYERISARNYSSVNIMTFHALAARLLRRFWKNDFTINDENDSETLTFDDLLKKLLEIFENPEILKSCQDFFSHIMVDEYQDVNEDQIKILQKLALAHQNICVVGDMDQTIYSWRGANIKTMVEFTKLYPNAQTVVLTKNYRNPADILSSAQNLISNNTDRIPVILNPIKNEGCGVLVWKAKDFFEHTEILMHLLAQKLGSHNSMIDADILDNKNFGFSFSDVAIIYRTQEEGKKIAQKLEKHGYPYQMSSPQSFFERSEIKKFLKNIKPLAALPSFPDVPFSKWIMERIEEFIKNENLKADQENRLKLLISITMKFNDKPIKEALMNFLDETKTEQEADNLINLNLIQLLTFHAAKGLEFPIVLICGLEEEIIPHKKSINDPYLLAEERRLLYVGMTRASNELHLLVNCKNGKESRFIKEIGPMGLGILPEPNIKRLKKWKNKRAQQALF